ncbi:hypothetical protein [Paraburkholderia youngii]|uniref:hypothetical protein n=1 Tax=Paraburkholderia youngii TaxID=2782701 RepID=UPI003D20D4E1
MNNNTMVSTRREPPALVALAKGTVIMAVILGLMYAAMYGTGHLCVTHGLQSQIVHQVYHDLDFATASLTQKYSYIGGIVLINVLQTFGPLTLIGIFAVVLLVGCLMELGGKEIWPRW